jgi:hypothetical protein
MAAHERHLNLQRVAWAAVLWVTARHLSESRLHGWLQPRVRGCPVQGPSRSRTAHRRQNSKGKPASGLGSSQGSCQLRRSLGSCRPCSPAGCWRAGTQSGALASACSAMPKSPLPLNIWQLVYTITIGPISCGASGWLGETSEVRQHIFTRAHSNGSRQQASSDPHELGKSNYNVRVPSSLEPHQQPAHEGLRKETRSPPHNGLHPTALLQISAAAC